MSAVGASTAASSPPLAPLAPLTPLAPLYHQVYAALRDNLLAGVWPAGSLLPSERELCELYGVSRITARKALQQLADERLVSRRQGLGSVVNALPGGSTEPPPMPGTMQALLENVAAIGASTTGRLLEIVLARPPEAVRLAMAVGAGARLHRSRHLRLRRGEPIGLITTWLPRSIGRGISAADVERAPMLALLEQRGVKVAWATQSIAAVLADAEVAGHLGIAAGQPLVHLQRLVHDERDRPVEQLSALYRADRYEYRSLLRRDSRSPLAWSLT